ncbi:hypothetical protein GSY74_08030 [Sulfurovum sp. bin170]|uniref:hypothetical protein n=1 Tax=Sulfurovum sp. bin170 TaxID=2695268 RepID=UPI0013E038BE|nr:hypothetical protein [Sulfurovum sp. bin170]NEW61229.1 hypothetical protein [Sulfurovum sp. bin170]
MMRYMIFILVLFFIAGCGMSGSTSTDSSKYTLTDDTVANTDLNITDDSTLIATTDSEEREETILPQTFSIAFPSILKKESVEDNTTIKDESNNSITQIDENNQTADSNISVENNQTNDFNASSENNQTVDSNTSAENNETVEYCDILDSNETIENNQTSSEKENIAYDSLKDKIEKIERVIKISQVNLTVLEKAMPQILDNCGGIDFNTTCPFEENQLSVVMDNKTIVQISSIIEDNNITFPDINESGVSLGEVIYRKYSDDTLYQYGLEHNMSSKKLEDDTNSSKKEQYTFKWSDSSGDTLTQYSYEDNNTYSKVSIHYLLGEDDKELMHVTFEEDCTLLGKKETMNLTLVKRGDENGSFSITSDSIEEFTDGNETNVSRFSSNGDISEDSSLLLFSGSVSSENNSTEVETTTVLEDNRVRCDAQNSEEPDIKLYELNITGANLENGEYLIFAPETVVEEMNSLEIYEQSIGSFRVDGDEIQGGLRGDSYENILDKLIIIRLIESQESTDMFKIVLNEDRPTLEIVKY